jgi:hypothetical protein
MSRAEGIQNVKPFCWKQKGDRVEGHRIGGGRKIYCGQRAINRTFFCQQLISGLVREVNTSRPKASFRKSIEGELER